MSSEESTDAETKPVAKETPEEPKDDLPKFEKDLSNKITEKFSGNTEVTFVKPDRFGNQSKQRKHQRSCIVHS